MNDGELLALWPCQLVKLNRDEIKRALKIGYNPYKKCNGLSPTNHDYCLWKGAKIFWKNEMHFNLGVNLWYKQRICSEGTKYKRNKDRDKIQEDAVECLMFIRHIYDKKIIFLLKDDKSIALYREIGYQIITFYHCFIEYDAGGIMLILEYCIKKKIIDISSDLGKNIEERLVYWHSKILLELYVCSFPKKGCKCYHHDLLQRLEMLLNHVHNLKQRTMHYSLSSLMLKTINLEKEDLSASYYY
jgi:hypothetical protein